MIKFEWRHLWKLAASYKYTGPLVILCFIYLFFLIFISLLVLFVCLFLPLMLMLLRVWAGWMYVTLLFL